MRLEPRLGVLQLLRGIGSAYFAVALHERGIPFALQGRAQLALGLVAAPEPRERSRALRDHCRRGTQLVRQRAHNLGEPLRRQVRARELALHGELHELVALGRRQRRAREPRQQRQQLNAIPERAIRARAQRERRRLIAGALLDGCSASRGRQRARRLGAGAAARVKSALVAPSAEIPCASSSHWSRRSAAPCSCAACAASK